MPYVTVRDIESWDFDKLTNVSKMFKNSGVKTLDLSNWDVTKVTNTSEMFYGTSSLTTLNLGGWHLNSISNVTSMFTGTGITDIKTPTYIKPGIMIYFPTQFVWEFNEYCLGSGGSSGCSSSPDNYPWYSTLSYYAPKNAWIRNYW